MAMKFTQVPANAWQRLQMNAGIIVDEFTPSTGTIGNILGATTGGITFNSNPQYSDFGEDVDNVPANTWQLKRLDSYDPVISGTFLTVNAALVKSLLGGADVDTTDTTLVTPRTGALTEDDFDDIWFVGDYSDVNTGTSAGFLAVHLKLALNTTGFQISTSKDGKGQMAFEYHGHYDLTDLSDEPFEVYVKAGTT